METLKSILAKHNAKQAKVQFFAGRHIPGTWNGVYKDEPVLFVEGNVIALNGFLERAETNVERIELFEIADFGVKKPPSLKRNPDIDDEVEWNRWQALQKIKKQIKGVNLLALLSELREWQNENQLFS